ncbi:MAG: hypothetical protein ACPGED_04080, partial [Flavobacteriales bacterium]
GGMIQIEKTRTKMQLDFSRNPENFELQEYEWFFDPKSNEYIELQLGLRRLNSAQSHHLRKCEELMKDTEELIEWIQKEDRNEH